MDLVYKCTGMHICSYSFDRYLLCGKDNRLLENVDTYKTRYNRLQVEVEKLKAENEELKLQISSGVG